MPSTNRSCCALCDQYEPLVRAIAREFLRTESHQDFDDLLQVGRIALLRVDHRFDVTIAAATSPTAYVRRVIKHAMLNEMRRLKRQRRHPEALGESRPIPLENDVPDKNNDAAIFSPEELRQFNRWRSRLPNRDQFIIESIRRGRAQRETARTLGVTQPYISQRRGQLIKDARDALTHTL